MLKRIENVKKSRKVAVILIAIVILAVFFNGTTGESLVSNDDESLVVQSTLEMQETSVNSQVAGQLAVLNVKEGDTVAEGQIIAVVNSDTLLTQKDQAEAGIKAVQGQVASAQATYQKVLNGATTEELAQIKANYDLAESTYNRLSTLYGNGAISKSDYDTTATQYEIAKQQYQAAKKGAESEDKEIAASTVNTLQGQLEAAESALAEIETYLSKTEIKAPADGIITTLNVEQGELISTGLPIAVITNETKPSISCKVMEDQLAQVQLNKQVIITFPAYEGETFTGTVTQINKNADFAVKRATNANGSYDVVAFGVTVELDDMTKPLYAGMTVFVQFDEEV